MNKVEQARDFAAFHHGKAKQLRKYSGVPYIVHPEAVVAIVSTVTKDEDILAAAWLHDTVEDTGVTLEQIEATFGTRVASLVENLTDVSKPSDGNRVVRKTIDRAHTARAHPDAKTIKLADLIDNTLDIAQNDKNFAKVYLEEKAALLEVLKEGDSNLHQRARETLSRAIELVYGAENPV